MAWAGGSKIASVVKVAEYSSPTDVSLCAKLNRYLYSGDGVAAKPYIKLTPRQSFTVELSYNGICIKGLKPRTHYQFTINRGIPLGEFKLDRDYTLSGTTTDYEPSLHFKDDGYILPAKGEISIPIETINVKELAITLYRINTNNLIGKINDYGLVRALYSYNIEKIASTEGYFLWTKRLRIRSEVNQPKVTAIPVGDFLKERKPGVYILQAQQVNSEGEPVDIYESQTQWFMVSDIGLYTLRGDDGLTVYTKRLSTAENYDGVKLELISKNNEVLDRTVSKEGKAFFPDKVLKGRYGLKPKAIYAYGEADDFSVIDLSKPPHDLSDRGVAGRDNPGRYDAYIYSNRGIFRPGETVPIQILLRNKLAQAQKDVKLSMKLFDSRQVKVEERLLTTDELGHIGTELHLSESASTGKWYLGLYAGGSETVGSLSFLVEDFVPPKIKIDIKEYPKVISPKKESLIRASIHYLNGLPLPHATVEVTTILHRAKTPFKGYEAYQFGDMKERFGNRYLQPVTLQTDADGNVAIPFTLDGMPDTTLPLSAHITISASEPGGRPVEKVVESFIENLSGYIGIKPNFEKASVDMEAHPTFDLVYLQDSRPAAGKLEYRLVREEVHWNWQSGGDDWTYNKSYSDAEEVSRGSVTTSQEGPVTLSLPRLDWGTYRLEVKDIDADLPFSSYRFSSGYEESTSKASPDRLPVAVDKQSYGVGEEVRVHITPKFSGPVIVSVANHTIIESKTIEAKAGEAQDVTFVVGEAWGSSTYILATAFRAQSKKLGANRAIGLAHIQVVDPRKIIELSLEYPKKVKSSTSVRMKVKAASVAGKKAYVTIAAVDEGVLRLTNYQSPDPVNYFFGQQKLGLEIRDIYGDLIETMGAHAKFDVGAGDILPMALQEKVVVNKRKVVALFKGPLAFDDNGVAEVTLDIPDYQGALRVMAVAWSEEAVGVMSGELVVKDTISPEIYMPRFLSVGDEATGQLQVDFDSSAGAGNYTIRFESATGSDIVDRKTFHYRFDASKAASFVAPIILRAPALKDLNLTVTIEKDGRMMTKKTWQLAVRSRYPEVSIRKVGILDKGTLFDPQAHFDAAIWSNPRHVSLKISGKPLVGTTAIANDLIDYWGRCAEQTTSRAMPWLFMPPTSPLAKTINVDAIVPRAIEQLLAYQKLDGGFGLWSGSRAGMWLSAYVVDFLTRAKKAGYKVPDRNIKAGLDWIENHLDRWSGDGAKQEADAYGLYVLTRNGRTLMAEILYRAKDPRSKMRSAQAWGHLGAALAYVGEKGLAEKMFEKAGSALGTAGSSYFSNYGGLLRDEAALVVLMQESALGLEWERRYADLASSARERRWLSTQEMSLLLRAAFAARFTPAKLKLTADGKLLPLTHGEFFAAAQTLQQLPVIANESEGTSWYSLDFRATPRAASFAAMRNNGFTITKRYFTIEGKEVDLSSVRQNERLVVVIEGKIQNSAIRYPLITDWVPAGFELENPHINGIDPVTALKWVGERSATEHTAYRNDRFIAALSRKNTEGNYRVAYVVRAVTVGSYTVPPAKVEDMYRPYYRAVSSLYQGRLMIHDPKQTAVKSSENTSSATGKPAEAKLTEKDFESVYSEKIKNLDRYSITQLNFLRNAIFARAGLDFKASNPMLYRMFSQHSWYHPYTTSSSDVYRDLTAIQKQNVQKLLAEEKRRGGGLVLADFYRVRIKALTEADLKKYDKHQLAILRNSLFARHGVSFHKPEYKRIFSYMPWYHPTDVSSAEVFDTQMSDLEKENVRLLQKMEKRRK